MALASLSLNCRYRTCPYVLSTCWDLKTRSEKEWSRRQDHLLFLMYIGTDPYSLRLGMREKEIITLFIRREDWRGKYLKLPPTDIPSRLDSQVLVPFHINFPSQKINCFPSTFNDEIRLPLLRPPPCRRGDSSPSPQDAWCWTQPRRI